MSLDGILEPFKRLSNKRLKMEWPLTIIVTIFFDFFLDFYFIQNINNKHLFWFYSVPTKLFTLFWVTQIFLYKQWQTILQTKLMINILQTFDNLYSIKLFCTSCQYLVVVCSLYIYIFSTLESLQCGSTIMMTLSNTISICKCRGFVDP